MRYLTKNPPTFLLGRLDVYKTFEELNVLCFLFHKGQTWHFVKVRKIIVRIKESFFFVVYAAEGQMIISKILRTFTKRKKRSLQIKHENVFHLFKN